MNSKIVIGLIITVLGLPLSLAFDCSTIANREYCEEIMNSALTEAEKNYLLADIMSNTKHYPDHELVKDWNEDILTDVAPEGISIQEIGYIKNAWVKILTVMPSVLSEDLLISRKGEIIAGSNHDIEIPTGTDSGDCRTERNLVDDSADLRLYSNEAYLGDNHKEDYKIDSGTEATFKADYIITVITEIKHYKWVQLCEDCGLVCRYDNTEERTDTLTISDILRAKISTLNPDVSFRIKDEYVDTTKAEFVFSDIVNIELVFAESSFIQHNYVFSEVASLEPLHILTVKADQQISQEEHNLVYEDEEITVKNTDECRIKVYDFFESKILPCNLDFNQIKFTINTDKTVYEPNETIMVEIEPEAEYLVKYGEQQFFTNGRAEFTAEFPANRISVTQQDKTEYKHIHVKDNKSWILFVTLGVFGGLNYVLITFIKKFWGMIF